ncbi:MAG: HAMP domain-containing histidine kinase [Candidimonas sp.]|nr:MAG: HAMP domain-containing histidine kinase [Candidimonas sp.]TAM19844.1 MAG: HAMP domain-containing histidine kinase [Candidimonas sp.]TAM78129.1 MAG: HAMP domain-containing histidine kinase [Candidimonas sp.]
MKNLTLSQRLSAVFAILLLASCGASAWLQIASNTRHEQEIVQRMSRGLAAQIAGSSQLMDRSGLRSAAVRELFAQLMAVNPSVEVYLLDNDGRIIGQDAPAGHLKRQHVGTGPIKRLLAGASLPIFGDDPRSINGTKVFSAAPLRIDGRNQGYIYVVLMGETRDALAADVASSSTLHTVLWLIALVALVGLLAGLIAFGLITRPLRRLTDTVRQFNANNDATSPPAASPAHHKAGDEIVILSKAFEQMEQRIRNQWQELAQQDQQRREMVANISHDLRTPLTSLHGYLETLLVKADTLNETERHRYLEVALGQSRKVGRLAQELFELARLESGLVQPNIENFSLADLVQDIFQKFELAAEARQLHLVADMPHPLPTINADLGMIERVLTNLLDNAIRHSPPHGEIKVGLHCKQGAIEVQISDSGPGIPAELRGKLFKRSSTLSRANHNSGGLGLLIVHRILQLHHSEIRLIQQTGKGAVFRFELSAAG